MPFLYGVPFSCSDDLTLRETARPRKRKKVGERQRGEWTRKHPPGSFVFHALLLSCDSEQRMSVFYFVLRRSSVVQSLSSQSFPHSFILQLFSLPLRVKRPLSPNLFFFCRFYMNDIFSAIYEVVNKNVDTVVGKKIFFFVFCWWELLNMLNKQ